MSVPYDRIGFVSRLSQVRRDIYGQDGILQLAQILAIPSKTWVNFESGVIIPDTIILRFICLTGVSAQWLLTGEGDRYSALSKPAIQFG